jgi:hypothetical protein
MGVDRVGTVRRPTSEYTTPIFFMFFDYDFMLVRIMREKLCVRPEFMGSFIAAVYILLCESRPGRAEVS